MFKLFNKIRVKASAQNKFGRYFKYAIGEIFLVVIGILIALQINNWNEKRKEQDRLLNIYSLISTDIKNDIQDLKVNLDFFVQKKPVFDKVLHDSITADLLDQGLSRLIGSYTTTTLNKTGVNQLKELQNKDSLSLKIINIYDLMETRLFPLERYIQTEIMNHSKFVRDEYSWYPEWISKTITKDNSSAELQAYFLTNSNYRNRVIYMYQQLYNANNYVPYLNYAINYLTNIDSELEEILNTSK